jgi:ADP-L-glycero-D-manno-heptose 6-epimerase
MVVVTGGAGFIGSAIVWQLNKRGIKDILIVDRLGTTEKWRNLVSLQYVDYKEKSIFIKELQSGVYGDTIEAIFHMGACSSTTERDADYLMENNFHYTLQIALWREKHPKTRFIYASSAATYGEGEAGYSDDITKLTILKPLNMYGYSKHVFDLYALREGWLDTIVGLKFFNVFGPNENHKDDMRSVINKAYARVRDEGVMTLFKSHNPGYADGEQLRDFIYVKDAVDMVLFFMDNPEIGGIFNIGTGRARTWNDLANALFKAAGKKTIIEYVPMPESIRDKYQYYTQSDTTKLIHAGCHHVCKSLEESIDDYVNSYLKFGRYLGEERNK